MQRHRPGCDTDPVQNVCKSRPGSGRPYRSMEDRETRAPRSKRGGTPHRLFRSSWRSRPVIPGEAARVRQPLNDRSMEHYKSEEAADPRVARLYAYIRSCNREEREALLLQLAGWFSGEPEAEFWTAIEQLTLLERAVEDVSLG